MTASVLTFPPMLQECVDMGALTPAQAWSLDLELTVFRYLPWSPAGRIANQRLQLYHWDTESAMVQ